MRVMAAPIETFFLGFVALFAAMILHFPTPGKAAVRMMVCPSRLEFATSRGFVSCILSQVRSMASANSRGFSVLQLSAEGLICVLMRRQSRISTQINFSAPCYKT
jgi:hypothetical protein